MTVDGFRKLALALPQAREFSHLDHPDIRVGKRIFATLGYPDPSSGMVKLAPSQQAKVMALYPLVFRPVNGAWGAGGSTIVNSVGALAGHAGGVEKSRDAGAIEVTLRSGALRPTDTGEGYDGTIGES